MDTWAFAGSFGNIIPEFGNSDNINKASEDLRENIEPVRDRLRKAAELYERGSYGSAAGESLTALVEGAGAIIDTGWDNPAAVTNLVAGEGPELLLAAKKGIARVASLSASMDDATRSSLSAFSEFLDKENRILTP